MESEATTPEVCVVKAEPENDHSRRTPQTTVAVDGQPDENETPSSTLDKLQAVVREKTGILEKLSALEKEEAPLKQRLSELSRKKDKMHQRLRELTNQELGTLPPAPAGTSENADVPRRVGPLVLRDKTPRSVQKRRKAHSGAESSGSMPKRAKRTTTEASLTFKQLQDFVDDLKQQGQFEGQLQCPVCPAIRSGPSGFLIHLYFHLGTKDHHFYKCPFEDCGFRTVLIGNVKTHVATSAHKAEWTEDMNERCIIQNNFDAFNALCRT